MKERKCLMSWQTAMFSGLIKDGICSIILVTIFLKVKLIISVWTPSLVPAPVDSPKLFVYPIGLRSWPPRGDCDFFSRKRRKKSILFSISLTVTTAGDPWREGGWHVRTEPEIRMEECQEKADWSVVNQTLHEDSKLLFVNPVKSGEQRNTLRPRESPLTKPLVF